jgi:hypothetical protein
MILSTRALAIKLVTTSPFLVDEILGGNGWMSTIMVNSAKLTKTDSLSTTHYKSQKEAIENIYIPI